MACSAEALPPVGAVSAEISLRVRDGAEVILDDVIVNFL
ncbi:non-contractile tail fiber protein [Klebsiella phage BUCT-3589]|uniref:Non-contractile tail fiber protein n=1 Tax=Klebsiella phage BUCT-3589 TaxID=2981541 RepID=A0A977TG39_9CAUD|nr:non-contractile tail fiber protein [Klebsiella phage BUCT-3589]